jgi:ArsR family transcriptional regulator, arsenate/arsenite/antimonite-responsive transcriptional repressor
MGELEQIFKGLADVTRLRIISLLLHGELCVCDIQRVLDSPQPNVSRHLTYLKNAGIVSDRREGPRMYYRLAQPNEGVRRQLFSFLQAAFQQDAALSADVQKLQKAIEDGVCNRSEWRPYSALARRKAGANQLQ